MFLRNTFCFIYYTLFLIQAYFSHQKVRTIFKGRKNVRRKPFLSVGPEKSRGSEKYEMQKQEGREVEWRATNPWMNETKRQKEKQKERIEKRWCPRVKKREEKTLRVKDGRTKCSRENISESPLPPPLFLIFGMAASCQSSPEMLNIYHIIEW